ncbi:hypothetical protein [Sphingomonas sp. ID0503]|uniref:hypothetical protein n=1 Tax=Sphingomonas sp. ID0503 TaxID=3399691 RepID=UPI003AFA8968
MIVYNGGRTDRLARMARVRAELASCIAELDELRLSVVAVHADYARALLSEQIAREAPASLSDIPVNGTMLAH